MNDARRAPGSPDAYFFEALKAGRLEVQCCNACGKSFFFPRTHCMWCHSPDHVWRPMMRGATLYSYSEIPGTDKAAARTVILADMDEGFRMMSTVIDADAADLCIGMRLQARPDAQNARVVFARGAA